VSYHETFWVVAGTAAPVIALAAVVTLPDSWGAFKERLMSRRIDALLDPMNAESRELEKRLIAGMIDAGLSPPRDPKAEAAEREEKDREFQSQSKKLYKSAFVNQLGSFANVVLQAGLLALSLAALTYGRDVAPPWVAIVLAVGGILLLAWTSIAVSSFREKVRSLYES
jgi:hypothetical protein